MFAIRKVDVREYDIANDRGGKLGSAGGMNFIFFIKDRKDSLRGCA